MAFGALQALEERGMGVPDQVSVMGFDDVPFSSLLRLTTVSQHPYEMGKGAITLLIDIIGGRVAPPQRVQLMPSLIIRGSCRRVS